MFLHCYLCTIDAYLKIIHIKKSKKGHLQKIDYLTEVMESTVRINVFSFCAQICSYSVSTFKLQKIIKIIWIYKYILLQEKSLNRCFQITSKIDTKLNRESVGIMWRCVLEVAQKFRICKLLKWA